MMRNRKFMPRAVSLILACSMAFGQAGMAAETDPGIMFETETDGLVTVEDTTNETVVDGVVFDGEDMVEGSGPEMIEEETEPEIFFETEAETEAPVELTASAGGVAVSVKGAGEDELSEDDFVSVTLDSELYADDYASYYETLQRSFAEALALQDASLSGAEIAMVPEHAEVYLDKIKGQHVVQLDVTDVNGRYDAEQVFDWTVTITDAGIDDRMADSSSITIAKLKETTDGSLFAVEFLDMSKIPILVGDGSVEFTFEDTEGFYAFLETDVRWVHPERIYGEDWYETYQSEQDDASIIVDGEDLVEGAEPELITEAESDIVVETESETLSEAESESETAETEVETESDTEMESETESETEARTAFVEDGVFLLTDSSTGDPVPGIEYELFEDYMTTIPAEGDTTSGTTDDAGSGTISAVEYATENEVIENEDGTTEVVPYADSGIRYIRFTNVPEEYVESEEEDGMVRPFYLGLNELQTYSLTAYAEGIGVQVSVIDAVKSMTRSMEGFTLRLDAWSEDAQEWQDTGMSFTCGEGNVYTLDGTLEQTEDNQGRFRVVDSACPEGYEAGSEAVFGIGDAEDVVSVTIDKTAHGNLLDILKRDDEGKCLGIIDLYYNGKLIASSNVDAEIEDMKLPLKAQVHVVLSQFGVTEETVQDGMIYSMRLPEDIVPSLTFNGQDLTQWKTLVQTGAVTAYGRLSKVQMGTVHDDESDMDVPVYGYDFELRLVHTGGNYDIEFGYEYDGNVHEKHGYDETVDTVFPCDKTLQFTMQSEPVKYEKKVFLSSHAGWTYEGKFGNRMEDLGLYSESTGGSDTKFNRGVMEGTIENTTDDPINMTLECTVASDFIMMWPLDTDMKDVFPVRLYVSDDGDSWTHLEWTENTGSPYISMIDGSTIIRAELDTGDVYSGYYSTMNTKRCLYTPNIWEGDTGAGYNGSHNALFNLFLTNVPYKYVRVVVYGDSVYGTSSGYREHFLQAGYRNIGSSSAGSFSKNYAVANLSMTVTSIDMPSVADGEYDKQTSGASSYKYFSMAMASDMSMEYWSNLYGLSGSNNTGSGNSSLRKLYTNDPLSASRYRATLRPGGDRFLQFLEQPAGDDWNNHAPDASSYKYFHSFEFNTGTIPSVKISVNGQLISLENSNRSSFRTMMEYDYRSFVDFKTAWFDIMNYGIGSTALNAMFIDSSTSCDGWFSRFCNDNMIWHKVLSYGDVSRDIWIVMDPQTWALARHIGGYENSEMLTCHSGSISGSVGDDTVTYGLPAGMSFYIFGLYGDELCTFEYVKNARHLSRDYRHFGGSVDSTYTPGDWVYDNQDYEGSCVISRNRGANNYGFAGGSDIQTGWVRQMITLDSRLLDDGAIQYTLLLDADALQYMKDNTSTGDYYDTWSSSDEGGVFYVFATVPYGYSLSSSGSQYMRYSRASRSGYWKNDVVCTSGSYDSSYAPSDKKSMYSNCTYLYDVDLDASYESNFSGFGSSSYGSCPVPEFLNDGGNSWYSNTYVMSYAAGNLMSDLVYYNGHYFYGITYIATPTSNHLGSDLGSYNDYFRSYAELVVPQTDVNGSFLPISIHRWIDAAAVTDTRVPSVLEKHMTARANTLQWHNTVKMSGIDHGVYGPVPVTYVFGSPSSYSSYGNATPGNTTHSEYDYFRGSYVLHDDMSGSYAVDKYGEVLKDEDGKIVDISRFIKLEDNFVAKSGSNSFTFNVNKDPAWFDHGEDTTNCLWDCSNYPMFGIHAWRNSLSGYWVNGYPRVPGVRSDTPYTSAYLLYAPNEVAMSTTSPDSGRNYGKGYSNMAGGFDLYIRNVVVDSSPLFIDYDTYFDADAFAKEFPNVGHVTLHIQNSARRGYKYFMKEGYDKKSNTWTDQEYAVIPDVDKESVSLSLNTYTRSYRVAYDVGRQAQKSAYLVDQIEQVTGSNMSYYRMTDTYGTSKAGFEKFLDLLDVHNIKIYAREYINPSKYKDVLIAEMSDVFVPEEERDGVSYEGCLFVDGHPIRFVDDCEWTFRDATAEELKAVKVPSGFNELKGNSFAWVVERKDGEFIPANSSFVVTYDVTLDHEGIYPENDESRWEERNMEFRHAKYSSSYNEYYRGKDLQIRNHAAIAYHVYQPIETESTETGLPGEN